MLTEEQKFFAKQSLEYWKTVILPMVNEKKDAEWRLRDFPWGVKFDPLCRAYYLIDDKRCGAMCPFAARMMNCYSDNSPFDMIRLARGFGHNKWTFKRAVEHYIAFLKHFSSPHPSPIFSTKSFAGWKKKLLDIVEQEIKLDDDIKFRKRLKAKANPKSPLMLP